jgi:hypothetical protein
VSRAFSGCTVTEIDRLTGAQRVLDASAVCVRTPNRICIKSDRSGRSFDRCETHAGNFVAAV